jgi:glycosyltransferase involved in cell wall biosynthesis
VTRISGIVVAANESERIGHALACLLPWCDEVIVVDQASQDDTVAIAEQAGARVIRSARMGSADPGRPIGVEAATGDYALIVDADESVHPRLAARLREIAAEGMVDVVWVPRLNIELGHWMRFGHSWPSRKPRFFRIGSLTFRDKLHEGFVVREGSRELRLPADPKLALWHFSYPSVEKLLDTVNRYTTIEAQQRTARGRRPIQGPTGALRAGAAYLWREYLRGSGYRDGMAGLIVGLARAWYRFLIEAKRWDQARIVSRKEREVALRTRLASGFATPSTLAGSEIRKSSSDLPNSDTNATIAAAT